MIITGGIKWLMLVSFFLLIKRICIIIWGINITLGMYPRFLNGTLKTVLPLDCSSTGWLIIIIRFTFGHVTFIYVNFDDRDFQWQGLLMTLTLLLQTGPSTEKLWSMRRVLNQYIINLIVDTCINISKKTQFVVVFENTFKIQTKS